MAGNSTQNINQDKANQSAINTISDVSVNIMSNKLVKMNTDDRDNVKSSTNFLYDSQKKLQTGNETQNKQNIFINGDKNINNQINEIFSNKRQSQVSNASPFMDLKKIVDASSSHNQNFRRISNMLDLPSPSNFAISQNIPSYGRRNSDKTQVSQKTMATSKKRNFLKVFFLTYKFLSKMRFIRQYKNIYMLEKRHFKLIKDNAFGDLYERQGHKNIFYKGLSNLYYFLFDIKSPFHAFQPNSLPLLMFDLSMLAILIFLVFYIPNKVCFSHAQGFSEHHSITSFIDVVPYILMLEIFINLNTAYFSQGTTVNDRKLIIKNYISFKFWVDLITIICLNSSNIVPLVFILRAYQIFKILYNFDETFQIQYKFPTTFELTKLVIIILFVAHVCACGFHLILDYQSSNLESWIIKSNLQYKPWIEIYVAALYFSFTTMITVGFGDIVPYTLLERIYVIFIQLISCGVFAYAINTVGSNQTNYINNNSIFKIQIIQQIGIFQEIARKSAEYRQQKQEIIDYMMRRKITKATQIKVLKYLEYIHSSSEAAHKKGYEILNLLSKRLKDVVYKEYYGRILIQKFLRTLSLYMKEQTLGPGEILFNEGELDQRLFYIQSGEIEQYADLQENGHKDIILSTLKSGDYFGQYGFLGNQKSRNSARSLNVSQLVYCTLEDFIFVIRQFPNDFETYCSLKDSIVFSNEKLDVECSGCGKFSHQVLNCPLFHYEIDKEAHIRRYIHSDPQTRDKNFRRDKPNFNKFIQRSSVASKQETNLHQDQLEDLVKNKNGQKSYSHQRFNVFKEYNNLRINLKYLRLKLADEDENLINEEQLQKLYLEIDDRKFILETKVPYYQTMFLNKQKNIIKYGQKDEFEHEEDEEDYYEEEFADYEDIMNNDHSQILPPHFQLQHQAQSQSQSIQRMSTLSSQVHVPTEKSHYLKMPSDHNFKASGKNKQVVEYSSEDCEEEEEALQQNKYSWNSLNKNGSSGFQVTFKEEGSSLIKKSVTNHYGKTVNNNVNTLDFNSMNQSEEDVNNSLQQKSLFYRGNDQQMIQHSPTRIINRHKTMNPSSFNSLQHNVDTYIKSSNFENNPSSMGSIILQSQNQGAKRKGTVLSSAGQGSSKLRNQGSQEFISNVQRTGTLNSKGIIRNTHSGGFSSKKLSEKNTIERQKTGTVTRIESKKEKSRQVIPQGTQIAKYASSVHENFSEKRREIITGSQYTKQDSNCMFKLMDFDRLCEFTHYLPWNNLSAVLKLAKKFQKRIKVDLNATGIKSIKTYKTARTTKYFHTLINVQQASKKDNKYNETNQGQVSIANVTNQIPQIFPQSDKGLIKDAGQGTPKSDVYKDENKSPILSFQQ